MLDHRTARDRADRSRRARAGAGLGLAVLVLCAATPGRGSAQLSGALAGHVGRTVAVPGRTMLDVAGEVGQGPIALRVGFGMDAAGTPLGPMLARDEVAVGLWTTDVDAGLALGRLPLLDRLVGGWNPTVFVGAGLAGVPAAGEPGDPARRVVVPTWTWGGRAGLPLLSWLGLEGEARHRAPLGDVSPEDYPAGEEWEYRVGLALRFGGAAPRASVPRPAAPRDGRAAGGATRTVRIDDARRGASAAEIADRTIGLGERYIGTPYVWGGETPDGFDCSGFVQYVYRRQGIELPRVSRDQAHAGRPLPVTLNGAARGDLLFFASDGRTVSHVAIYAGDGRILHSSSSGRGVRYDDLAGRRGGWYVDHLVAVRRVIDDGYAWPDVYAGDEPSHAMPTRALPLDDAFDALVGDRGDEAAPSVD